VAEIPPPMRPETLLEPGKCLRSIGLEPLVVGFVSIWNSFELC
jgi:hypothetical protein